METSIVIVALIGFVAFRYWLRHHGRVLIHRERMMALEKGLDLPPLQEEVQRRQFNFRRLLLLSGLIWLAVGLSGTVVAGIILAQPYPEFAQAPRHMELIGLIPAAIGLAQLIVYWTDRKERP
jgi:hypothetical protein